MYIAKMTTRYPDYHGEGYYNFLIGESSDEVHWKIVDYSHDFIHVKTVKTEFSSVEEMMEKYPTKSELDKAVFNG